MDDSIIYSLITCRSVPLCHYSAFAGTYKRFCLELLSLIDTRNQLLSYKYNQYYIHCLVSEQIFCFVCITSEKYSVPVAFSFLTELDKEFKYCLQDEVQKYRTQQRPPLRFELNKAFLPCLIKLVNKYSNTKVDVREKNLSQPLPHIQTLDPFFVRRHLKVPLLVQSIVNFKTSKFGVQQMPKTQNRISEWLTRHPYSTIIICVILCLLILLYFVVIVPLCGSTFQKIDASGRRVCWLPTTNGVFTPS
jgi:hypothetical protein